MCDDVITLDSSDEETPQKSVADQLRQKYTQLNITSVKGKPQTSPQSNSQPSSSGGLNILKTNSSVSIKKVQPPIKTYSSVNNKKVQPPIKTNSSLDIKKVQPPIKTNSSVNIKKVQAPVKTYSSVNNKKVQVSGKTNSVNIRNVQIATNHPQMPVILHTSSLANSKNSKKSLLINPVSIKIVDSTSKVSNVTNVQNNIGKLSSGITIMQGGKVMLPGQVFTGNKRTGGNIAQPPQKKRKTLVSPVPIKLPQSFPNITKQNTGVKITPLSASQNSKINDKKIIHVAPLKNQVNSAAKKSPVTPQMKKNVVSKKSMPQNKKAKINLDTPTKKALDNIVRQVARKQLIQMDKKSTEPIPTVEIDDDDDDNVVQFSGAEIPIEYEPDNSKENVEVEVPPFDPLAVDEVTPMDSVCLNEDSRHTPIVESSVSVDSDQDMEVIGDVPVETSKETDQSVDNSSLEESVGVISANPTAAKDVTSASDDIELNPIEINDEEDVGDLSRSDFYTPKKVKESNENDLDNTGNNGVVKNISDNLNGSSSKLNDEVVNCVPVEVKIRLTPEDKKKVEEFERDAPKKRVELKFVDDLKDKSKTEKKEICEVYQRFIDQCLKLDPSSDMKKIIDKKVRAYYFSVPSGFIESKSFAKFIEGKINDINENPGSLFLYIKEVVDELKVRRCKKKDGPSTSTEEKPPVDAKDSKEAESSDGSEDEVEDKVLSGKIRKLEKAMRKLNRAIKVLEEREVDCDDENSAYLLVDRYKSRLVRIYQKLCELTGERDEALNRRSGVLKGLSRLILCGGRFPKLVSAVKAAAKSKLHWFPDFTDVLKCVEHCANEQNLNLKSDDLQREATEAFEQIGTLLQQKRREKEMEDFSCMLGSNADPAEEDPELAKALERNKELSKNREMEVINKFVEKQKNLKLIAEDVSDAEADKSEGSDDESEEECVEVISKENEKDSNTTDKSAVDKEAEQVIDAANKPGNVKIEEKDNNVTNTSMVNTKTDKSILVEEVISIDDKISHVDDLSGIKDNEKVIISDSNKIEDGKDSTNEINHENDVEMISDEISSMPVIIEARSLNLELNKDGIESNLKVNESNVDMEIVSDEKDKKEVVELDNTSDSSSLETNTNIDEDKSNSSVSLIELNSSDSKDSSNSGCDGDSEGSKRSRLFKKLKTVRPSSVLSGINLLNDDGSSSFDSRKDGVVMDVDADESVESIESDEETSVTVIERKVTSDMNEDDNAVENEVGINEIDKSNKDGNVTKCDAVTAEEKGVEDKESACVVKPAEFVEETNEEEAQSDCGDKYSDPLLCETYEVYNTDDKIADTNSDDMDDLFISSGSIVDDDDLKVDNESFAEDAGDVTLVENDVSDSCANAEAESNNLGVHITECKTVLSVASASGSVEEIYDEIVIEEEVVHL